MDAIDKKEQKNYEKCVFCGTLTRVPVNLDIEYRSFYIEGAGQLCYDCHKKIYCRREKNGEEKN